MGGIRGVMETQRCQLNGTTVKPLNKATFGAGFSALVGRLAYLGGHFVLFSLAAIQESPVANPGFQKGGFPCTTMIIVQQLLFAESACNSGIDDHRNDAAYGLRLPD